MQKKTTCFYRIIILIKPTKFLKSTMIITLIENPSKFYIFQRPLDVLSKLFSKPQLFELIIELFLIWHLIYSTHYTKIVTVSTIQTKWWEKCRKLGKAFLSYMLRWRKLQKENMTFSILIKNWCTHVKFESKHFHKINFLFQKFQQVLI